MDVNKNSKTNTSKTIFRGALNLAVAAGLSLIAGSAFAQNNDTATMAPPVENSAPVDAASANGSNAAADSVFNWQEIPANQNVPLSRASFDQGGYQLYDTVGETIIVPFTNHNLYVMKFAESPNGKLYFVNQGGYPVLYVPHGGYLNNASVSGARWYPFGAEYHPVQPVFLGIAPSYSEFIGLGWYSNTFLYGGYYGHTSFLAGGLFLPTIGLFFEVGGHPYYGWNGYHNYYFAHPGFYHVGYYNRNYYHYAGRQYSQFASGRHFGGYSGGFHHGYVAHNTFGGHNYTVNNRSYTVNNFNGGQHFGGQSYSGHTFRGAANFGGGRSYGGGSYSRAASSYQGGHSFGSGGHSFSGGAGHSFSGGGNRGGGRSFGGGGGRR